MVGTGVEMLFPFLVILGLFTRWAAFGLILYVLAATYIGHPVVWRVPPDAFFRELMGVMKNLAMIGGLLLLIGAGPGRFAAPAPARRLRGVSRPAHQRHGRARTATAARPMPCAHS